MLRPEGCQERMKTKAAVRRLWKDIGMNTALDKVGRSPVHLSFEKSKRGSDDAGPKMD